ncbi:MAG: Peptidase protein [Chthonomonadaceae bacterium]|nr:Peptidase protein [Chthonomonadaceae bacterium]
MARWKQFRSLFQALGGLAFLSLLVGVILTAAHRTDSFQSPEPDLPVGAVTVKGNHVVVHALPVEQANARYLANLGDAALETYARALGVKPPRDPIAIYLLDTAEDYERADALYNAGTTRYNQGFTHDGRVFLHLAPRPGQTVLDSGSMITRLLAHEICHALHQRLFPGYNRHPCWLKEGLADAWAERALSATDTLTADRLPGQSSMLIALRQAAQEGEELSIAHILTQPQSAYCSQDGRQQYLTYSRSFALVRMLDDPAPANTPRRLRFRAFLKEVDALDGDNVASQVNARFLEQFGDAHLAELQAELRRRTVTEKIFPWEQYSVDVHPLTDGALLAEADLNHSAIAFADQQRLSPTAHLHARIDAANVGQRQANLLFGRTTLNDYYMLAFGPGYVTLLRHRKNYETLAARRLDANLFTSGSHTLDVYLGPKQARASLDDHAVGTFYLRSGEFPPGQWGIGATNARITFHDMTAENSPP